MKEAHITERGKNAIAVTSIFALGATGVGLFVAKNHGREFSSDELSRMKQKQVTIGADNPESRAINSVDPGLDQEGYNDVQTFVDREIAEAKARTGQTPNAVNIPIIPSAQQEK